MKSNGTKLGTKKIIMILALALCLILAGCGGNSGSQNETPAQTTEKEIVTTEAAENETETEPEEEEETESALADNAWYAADNTAICEGVYFTGKDIAADSFILTCTNSEHGMNWVIFESEENYWSYHKTHRFTGGEEADALDAYALNYSYLGNDRSCEINLHEGYVFMITIGKGTLTRANGSDAAETAVNGKAITVSSGTYQPGDIAEGQYILTCTDAPYSMSVIAFENSEDYDSYMNADHFTVGEESTAIEQYAMYDLYVSVGESMFVNIREGMVLLLENGTAQMEGVSMSWAD